MADQFVLSGLLKISVNLRLCWYNEAEVFCRWLWFICAMENKIKLPMQSWSEMRAVVYMSYGK